MTGLPRLPRIARFADKALPPLNLPRPSFRQLLLVGFLLVATLLGAVALRSQFTMERLLKQSRAGAERTLQLSGHSERLGEQGLAMERAARQYLVLRDEALRAAYERAATDAQGHVQALAADVKPELVERWNGQRTLIERQLAAPPAVAGDRVLAQAFRELDALHSLMAEQVRGVTEQRNAELQAELEAGRSAVARLVAVGVAVALVLALVLALWFARPLRRVETAILALGENRFDDRIEIRGPADVRQLGRRLEGLRQRLQTLEADKARFLRHVSHELKTPLAALREGVALLQDEVAGPLSENQREVARILHDNTAALQSRIEDLLRFNAAAFAAQRLVRKPVDVGALVQRLVQEQQLLWKARELQLEVSGMPVKAEVDAELLASAIGNLLVNAIRYSPPGATIAIIWMRDGDGLRIEVADQGPGVPEAERDRIFEPFFRGQLQPADGALAGTGIGLSIVAETVAAHGGRVTLQPNQPGQPGARFRIELPHACD